MIEEELDVLLVEDNPGDARLIEVELEDTLLGDFELTWVETLKAGLEEIRQGAPDAILLDLSLPDSQGMETVDSVLDQAVGVPIVVLTGLDDEETGAQAVRRGAQDYLVKGEVDGDRLAQAVHYAVERQEAKQELEELRKHVAMNEKLASLGALVSGLSREIRSSTTHITNALFQIRQRIEETARSNPELTDLVEDVADYNAAALDGVSRIDDLVRDLRQFTESGAQSRQSIGLQEPVEAAAEVFRKTHQSRINLVTEIDQTPPVELNPIQIEQVVLNMLRNAADAMPEGGTVWVRTRTEGDDAVAEVEDTGEGITRYVERRMFEPFFTTRENADGLGLAISKRIVEAHRGEIEWETEKGEGTTFRIRLPVAGEARPDG